MPDLPPARIAIDNDDYVARHVGHTHDGRQFFLTNPFIPAGQGGMDNQGCEFIALYLFAGAGEFLEAKIENLGPRAGLDEEKASRLFRQFLEELGPITHGRIEVAPFELERFGTTFGLVLREPEDDEDPWCVEAQPGNYMAFFEPWDSGEYDT